MEFETLKSEVDASVNFVHKIGPGEALEARYVRRHPEYVACYLSSQTGCEQACRFCWLTATGQNKLTKNITDVQVVEQARKVLEYYSSLDGPEAKVVHYNFMARGDFFANDYLLALNQRLFESLGDLARSWGLLPRFLLSTILPEGAHVAPDLAHTFPVIQPEIYYSLYSMNPDFRRRWLPRATDPNQALEMLAAWQDWSKKILRIHYALIEGQNDSPEDAQQIADAVKKHGIHTNFTLVRYNPPTGSRHTESPNYAEYAAALKDYMPGVQVTMLNRVGPDVAASCGQFINVK